MEGKLEFKDPRAFVDAAHPNRLTPSNSFNDHTFEGGPTAYIPVPQQDARSSHPNRSSVPHWTVLAQYVAWAPELASIGLAVLSLASIVVLLATQKDKPLPDWPSLLGINSLVALLTAVLKVALLHPVTEGLSELKWLWYAVPQPLSDFDHYASATRSPWEAARFILSRRVNVFASFGAAIIILSLSMDTFTQQILQFYSCQIPLGGNAATVSRTNNYTIGGSLAESVGPWLDARLTGAVYQGMLNPPANASAAQSFYCPSGNCTFSHTDNVAYSSLAICTSVEDISSTITGNGSLGQAPDEGAWQYFLPSGLNISYTLALATSETENSGTTGPNSPLFKMEILSISTNCTQPYAFNHQSECPLTPLAFTVTISPCVLEYGNVSVSNAVFDEQVKNTQWLPDTGSGYAAAGNSSTFPGTDCTGSATPQDTKTFATGVNGAGFRCVYTYCVPGSTDIVYYDPACIFNFDSGPTGGLTSALGDMFGSIASPNTLFLEYGIWEPATGDAWLKVLFSTGNANLTSIADTFQGFASSLNAVIRDEGDASNSEPARGVVLSNQTCVGVEWAWLSLPAALVGLALVFLAGTVARWRAMARAGGAEGGRVPWKSSTLPMLWCGLQDAVRERHGQGLGSVEEMESLGRGLLVSLRTDERAVADAGGQNVVHRGGWALREVME